MTAFRNEKNRHSALLKSGAAPQDGNQAMNNKRSEWVKQFLLENFKASWEIDLLIILKKEPEKLFTPQALKAILLCADEFTIVACLDRLAENGMVRKQGTQYQYYAKNLEISVLIDRLTEMYSSNRLSLIRSLYESRSNNTVTNE